MTIRLSTGLRNGMLNATGLKEAMANGTLWLFSGPQPADADQAATGTLLIKITKAGGAFSFGSPTNGINLATPAAGVITKDTDIWSGLGLAAGTIGWYRLMGNASDDLLASTSLPRVDGSVATAGADLNLVSVAMALNTPLTIDGFSFTFPGA